MKTRVLRIQYYLSRDGKRSAIAWCEGVQIELDVTTMTGSGPTSIKVLVLGPGETRPADCEVDMVLQRAQ